MKRVISFLTAVALCFCLTSCRPSEKEISVDFDPNAVAKIVLNGADIPASTYSPGQYEELDLWLSRLPGKYCYDSALKPPATSGGGGIILDLEDASGTNLCRLVIYTDYLTITEQKRQWLYRPDDPGVLLSKAYRFHLTGVFHGSDGLFYYEKHERYAGTKASYRYDLFLYGEDGMGIEVLSDTEDLSYADLSKLGNWCIPGVAVVVQRGLRK